MKKKPSVIFMGTPDFAVPTLNALHQSAFSVRLVITQPDRPKGRGRKLAPPPVKLAAQEMGYEIYQPEKIRDLKCVEYLSSLRPDFLVVVAFGQILPKSVLSIPKIGPVNVHASLLPKYRGPAPIQWTILRGEAQTGITTMLMDHGVDTGDILLTSKIPITLEDTASSLHDTLSLNGAQLLMETLCRLWEGSLFPRAQKHDEATYAPMLKKSDGRLDWQKPASQLDAQIRAMTPWPGTFCYLENNRYRILKARRIEHEHHARPGSVLPGFVDELRIAAGKDALSILKIQPPSGKRLIISDFLRGHPMKNGMMFS
ncbi:MAG: methionyl-tRNA formyltransferase [Desulfobacteraceae bacterium]|nr:methionyl-tRNA formyltransferase [Desulfobacteraceae bacterium]